MILAWRKLRAAVSRGLLKAGAFAAPSLQACQGAPEPDPSLIDVRDLMRRLSVEELCQTAEGYFANLGNREGLMAKPFNDPSESPAVLITFAHVLQGLLPIAGRRVLDFGCGPGWSSRFLTQLGAEVVCCDVSATALSIAREALQRQPPFGQTSPPEFLHFDGRRFALPDECIDRIMCLSAFHHVPNPRDVLLEMGRVLRPGGVAGFSEPGPNHSRSQAAQHEMRTHHVVENDVVIEEIWEQAREAGFTDIKLAIFQVTPPLFSLRDFTHFMAGSYRAGRTFHHATWLEMQENRLFFLYKGPPAPPDSRTRDGLKADIAVELAPAAPGDPVRGRARLTNSGTASWWTVPGARGEVMLACHALDADGGALAPDLWRGPVRSASTAPVLPGQTVCLDVQLPPLPGRCRQLEFDLVAERVAWFSHVGSPTTRVPLGAG